MPYDYDIAHGAIYYVRDIKDVCMFTEKNMTSSVKEIVFKNSIKNSNQNSKS
jgi:hypothetical protein